MSAIFTSLPRTEGSGFLKSPMRKVLTASALSRSTPVFRSASIALSRSTTAFARSRASARSAFSASLRWESAAEEPVSCPGHSSQKSEEDYTRRNDLSPVALHKFLQAIARRRRSCFHRLVGQVTLDVGARPLAVS